MPHKNIDIQDYLLSKVDSIILRKILLRYPVKNIRQFIQTMLFLAHLDKPVSVREIHGIMKNNDFPISLITLNEYIGFLLEEKLISKIPRYEIKTHKIVQNKVEYYFSDTATRDAITEFKLGNNSRMKNSIFSIFDILRYTIFTGKNRSFSFDFILIPPNISSPFSVNISNTFGIPTGDDEVLFIDVFDGTSKTDLKKLLNKMIKIHHLPGENSVLKLPYKKYIIVESLVTLGIQKRRYEDVEIIEIEKFMERY